MVYALALGLSLSSLAQGSPVPQTAVYTNEDVKIAFTHPATWKIETRRLDAWATIPLESGASAALNVMGARFNANPTVWQNSQEDINKQLGYEILRQWQEEILGVPLLMTKFRSGPGKLQTAIKAVPSLPIDQPLVTLVGLVYSATPRKLHFRLTAPEGAYDEAEFAFRKVLETIRTSDGRLPQPETPERQPEPIPEAGTKAPRPPAIVPIGASSKPIGPKPSPQRAPQLFEANPAGRRTGFYYPDGWTVLKAENGTTTLKHTATGYELRFTIHSTLDSEAPMRAFFRASGESLKSLDSVDDRQETEPAKNPAGATTARLWRVGKDKNGVLHTFEAVAGTHEHYVLFSAGGRGGLDAARMKLVDDLLKLVSVETIG